MALFKKTEGILYTSSFLGAGLLGLYLWSSNYSLEYKSSIALGIASIGLFGTVWYISKLKRDKQSYESKSKKTEALSCMSAVHVGDKELSVKGDGSNGFAVRKDAAESESTPPSVKGVRSISDFWNFLKTWLIFFGRRTPKFRPADALELPIEDEIDTQTRELKMRSDTDLNKTSGFPKGTFFPPQNMQSGAKLFKHSHQFRDVDYSTPNVLKPPENFCL